MSGLLFKLAIGKVMLWLEVIKLVMEMRGLTIHREVGSGDVSEIRGIIFGEGEESYAVV